MQSLVSVVSSTDSDSGSLEPARDMEAEHAANAIQCLVEATLPTSAPVAAEPSFKSSKERRAHFKAHRVTLLEPPRSEKRKAADEPAGGQWRVI